ncbi:MAG: enolase [Candidatus Omnitrophica bacterium]|nr:enolase [Candidatus Omnitrophota bacterium]
MRIRNATFYALKIPFVESFSHSIKTRKFSDSIIAGLTSEDGAVGYGEGVPRSYVTGETVETCLDTMKNRLWPAVAQIDYSTIASANDLPKIPEIKKDGVIAWNAAQTAFELALIDCLLKREKRPLSTILPPKRQTVIYSGVITSSSKEKAVQLAKYLKLFAVKQIKVKIDGQNDKERLAAIRDTVGPDISLRVDANGAFDVKQAIGVLKDIVGIKIDCIEQPIPRGNVSDLAKVKAESPIPVMVDESLVTLEDAENLISAKACDFFNLRISKCGGVSQTLQIAKKAEEAGMRLQLGAQVGETAVLSAAGRHVAAYLDSLEFVEGSYGTMLLTEDISDEKVDFGHGGKAPLLRGEGLGVHVREEILKKYADKVIECGKVK